ncbi:hypothetical protein [Vibrio tapetis]|uniref:Uncharacterized protein n=1 Tax=Vibrio tapetis subsp. tapetis TaxID=1671868 RepID=A0A2N8ZI47_9VIBR|nr:hypothetical protein [Vibrio tapetis]SON51561.1 conserved protein of unknown function [Vibrio tapetis subsp. tapetis]
MAQQNSTLTLSKCQTATSVSPLEHESSPKHDVSLSEGERGFIQLIDSDSKQILAQREGLNDEASFEYLEKYVWNMSEQVAMQFVAQTDHVHPTKFFCALPKEALVKCYLNQLTDQEPVSIKPCWEGLAEQWEENDTTTEPWDAFDSDGRWIGTSEC